MVRSIQNSILFLFFLLISVSLFGQNSVGIGTPSPNEHAVLELVSPGSDQGLLVPKLTTSQRTDGAFTGSLTSTENGLLVFDSDENLFYYWQDTQWFSLKTGVDLIAGTGIDITGGIISNTGDGDADPNNEIQDLQLSGTILTINNNVSATPIDLSTITGTDNQVLSFVKTGSDVDLDISNGNTVVINVDDADSDISNELQTLAGVLSESSDALGGIISNLGDPLAPQDAATKNYVDALSTDDADADPINEIQDISGVLSTGNDAGGLSISNLADPINLQDASTKNYVDNLSIDDADADPINEIQDLGGVLLTGNDAGALAISNLADPTGAQDAATKSYVDAININDADFDPANEIQDLTGVLSISNDAGALSISNLADPTNAQEAATKNYVDLLNTDDADADPTNEIQNLTITGNAINIDGGGLGFNLSALVPGSGEVLKWNGAQWEAATDATAAGSTLPVLGDAQIVTNNGSNTAVSISGDLNMDNAGTMTILTDAVSSAEIANGTITDNDINNTAAIAVSKLDPLVIQETENISLLTNDAAYLSSVTAGIVTVTPTGNLSSGDTQAALEELQGDIDADLDIDPTNEIQVASGVAVTPVGNLVSTDTQAALQELQGDIDADLDIDPTNEIQVASGVAVTPVGNLVSTDTQAALQELQGDIDADLDIDPTNEIQVASGVAVTPVGNLASTDTQAALQELQGDIDTDLDIDPTNEIQVASGVAVTPVGNLASTDTQAALQELQGDIDTDLDIDPTNEIQVASGVAVTPVGNLTSTDTQAALQELQGDIDTDLDIDPTNEIQVASGVAVTPVGNLASTDTQAALQELQGDIDADLDLDPTNEIQDIVGVITQGNDAGALSVQNLGNTGIGFAGAPSATLEIRPANADALRIQPFNTTGVGQIQLMEGSLTGSDYIAIRPPSNIPSTYTLQLPDNAGSSGEILSTNGSGQLSWITDDFGWGVTGNSSINAVTDFIGSTNSADVIMRSNNIERLRITAGGDVGIGGPGSAVTGNKLRIVQNLTGSGDGIESVLTTSGAGASQAFNASVTNSATASTAGYRSTVTNAVGTTGNGLGYFALMGGDGDGIRMGVNINITGGGTGSKYGYLTNVSPSSGANGYGLYVQDVTGSTSNYGIYIESLSGEPSFYSAIFMDGNVGIGTVLPATELDVAGTIQTDGFQLTSATSNGYVLTSNPSGVGSWAAIPSVFSTSNNIPKGNGTTLTGSSIYDDGVGHIGFGVPAPTAGIHSTQLDGTLLTGTFGSGSIPTIIAGTRLMWYPRKAAFRAGRIITDASDASIGDYSVMLGYDGIASGQGSAVIGFGGTATALASMAIGTANDVTTAQSVGLGAQNVVSATNSYSIGYINTIGAGATESMILGHLVEANGLNSYAFGRNINANGVGSFVIGKGVNSGSEITNTTNNSLMIGFNSNQATLFVGPATGAGTYGDIGIATSNPNERLTVNGALSLNGILAPALTAGHGKLYSDADDLFFLDQSGTTTTLTASIWNLTGGNSGTTPGTAVGNNYIGTSDAQDLLLATDGTERMRIHNTSGNMSIGPLGAGLQAGNFPTDRFVTFSADDTAPIGSTMNLELSGYSSSTFQEFSRIDFNNRASGANNLIARIGVFRGGPINEGELRIGTSSAGTYTEHLIITKDGTVGIGNPGSTSPAELLHIGTTTGDGIMFGDGEFVQDGGVNNLATNAHFSSLFNGSRDLGLSTNRWRTVYLTVAPDVSSDRRLKQNIKGIQYGLLEINDLRPVTYELKTGPGSQSLGLIAQEVSKIIPEVVNGAQTEEMLSIRYSELIPVLIKAIQEQQALIDQLSEKSSLNEKRFLDLEKSITQLLQNDQSKDHFTEQK